MQVEKRVKSALNARKLVPLAAAAIALVLIILVCIFAISASNIRNEYAAARNSVGEELYHNLWMFVSSFEGITLTGADVEGSILPAMHDCFVAARALDAAIVDAYGPRYSVLSGGIETAIPAAFDAFYDAFRTGRSTADAVAGMDICVQSLRQTLLTRFDREYRLLPAK